MIVVAIDHIKPWSLSGGVSDDTASDSGENDVSLPPDSEENEDS